MVLLKNYLKKKKKKNYTCYARFFGETRGGFRRTSETAKGFHKQRHVSQGTGVLGIG